MCTLRGLLVSLYPEEPILQMFVRAQTRARFLQCYLPNRQGQSRHRLDGERATGHMLDQGALGCEPVQVRLLLLSAGSRPGAWAWSWSWFSPRQTPCPQHLHPPNHLHNTSRLSLHKAPSAAAYTHFYT